MTFTPHASGSSGNFYTLRDGDAVIAIECGIRFESVQKACNFRVTDLVGCLVSHCHGDHAKSVREMMTVGVNCYASADTWTQLGVDHHRAHAMDVLSPVKIGPFSVLGFPLVHDVQGCLGFLIEGPRAKRLAFVSDTAYLPNRLEGVHIWAVEANYSRGIIRDKAMAGSIDRGRHRRVTETHMSIETLEKLLEANDLSCCESIYLLHLSASNSDEAAFKERIQRKFGVPTYIAGAA